MNKNFTEYIIPIWLKLAKSRFVRAILTLTSSNIAVRSIAFIVTPFLTNIYTPTAFGILALFISINAFGGVIATFRYEMSVLESKNDKDEVNLIILCLFLASFTSGLLFTLLQWQGESFLTLISAEALKPMIGLIPISIFCVGISETMKYWTIKHGFFRFMVVVDIITALVQPAVQIVLGIYTDWGAQGLIIGFIAAQIATAVAFTALTSSQVAKKIHEFSFVYLLSLAKSQWRFPIYMLPANLLSTFSTQIPVFLFNYFFNTSVVGYYSLASRVIGIPAQLLGAAITDVFRQRYASARSRYDKATLIEQSALLFLAIGFIPMLLLFAIAPKLFSVVFGEQWITSAQYVQILIPFYFLRFVSSPLSSVLLFDKNQAQYLKWQITHVIAITTGLLLVSLYLTTPNKILLVYSVINVLSYIYLLSVSFRSAGTNLYNLILSLKYMDRVQRT